jgi:hypothetical protein
MAGYESEEDELFEKYQRYVILNPGIPEDYDTWAQTQSAGQRRKKKQRPKKFTDYGD